MTTVAASSRIALKNILYLTDFSEPSETALPFAAAIAREYGSKIYVLHMSCLPRMSSLYQSARSSRCGTRFPSFRLPRHLQQSLSARRNRSRGGLRCHFYAVTKNDGCSNE